MTERFMVDFMQSGGTQAYSLTDPRTLSLEERRERYRQCLASGGHKSMAVVNHTPEVWTCRYCGIRYKVETRQVEVETL